MADDKTKVAPQDARLISLDEEYELAYWTGKFRVSKERLREAVAAVGHSAAAVEKFLRG